MYRYQYGVCAWLDLPLFILSLYAPAVHRKDLRTTPREWDFQVLKDAVSTKLTACTYNRSVCRILLWQARIPWAVRASLRLKPPWPRIVSKWVTAS